MTFYRPAPISQNGENQRDNAPHRFTGNDPSSMNFSRLSIHQSNFPEPREDLERGWRQPKFQPTQAYDRALAKERMLIPKIGGRSKKAQLGSIEESWGSAPISFIADPYRQGDREEGGGAEEEERKGMFELDEDPPSRNVSPFKEEDEELEIERKKQEFLTNARRGTKFEAMKDVSSFFEGGTRSDPKSYGGRQEYNAFEGVSRDDECHKTYLQDSKETVYPSVKHGTPDHRAFHSSSPYNSVSHTAQSTQGGHHQNQQDEPAGAQLRYQKSSQTSRYQKEQDTQSRSNTYRSYQTPSRAADFPDETSDWVPPSSHDTRRPGDTYRTIDPSTVGQSWVSQNTKYVDPEVPPAVMYTQAQDYQLWLKRLERGGKRR